MKLEEAAKHIGQPVLVDEKWRQRVRDGRITEVDHARALVRVEIRHGERGGYRWSGRAVWYAPCHLAIPDWAEGQENT